MRESLSQSYLAEGRAAGLAEGMALGMAEAMRSAVMRAMQLRFGRLLPQDLTAIIRSMNNLDQLGKWFDAALTAPNLEAFRIMVRS